MAILKTLARKTPPGRWIAERRRIKALSRWTESDSRAAHLYSTFIGPGDLVFDVGANIGERTKIFRHLDARVVAVEPQASCRHFIAKRFQGDRMISIVPAAVGADNGVATLRVGDLGVLGTLSTRWLERVQSSHRFGDSRWDRTEQCTVVTLDSLIAEHGEPSFVKIDVEGFEGEVLKGLRHSRPALSIEFTAEDLEACMANIQLLSQRGYGRFSFSEGDSLVLGAWMGEDAMRGQLAELSRPGSMGWGDVYAVSRGEADRKKGDS